MSLRAATCLPRCICGVLFDGVAIPFCVKYLVKQEIASATRRVLREDRLAMTYVR